MSELNAEHAGRLVVDTCALWEKAAAGLIMTLVHSALNTLHLWGGHANVQPEEHNERGQRERQHGQQTAKTGAGNKGDQVTSHLVGARP